MWNRCENGLLTNFSLSRSGAIGGSCPGEWLNYRAQAATVGQKDKRFMSMAVKTAPYDHCMTGKNCFFLPHTGGGGNA